MPRPEKQPQQYSHVAESLWANLDFIQARFHIGRYVSVSMDTQVEQEQIKALYSSINTTSKLIDVSFYAPPYLLTLRLFLDTDSGQTLSRQRLILKGITQKDTRDSNV
jgi:hypothetical protein